MSGRRPRARPPWWPADESWPPAARASGAPRFIRRILFFAFAFFVVVTALSVVSGLFFADRHGPPPLWGLFWIALIGAALVFAGRFTRAFSNPLGEVLGALDRLAEGDYSVRVEPGGPPPMRALGDALNTTAMRLAASEEQRRDFVADIAHEVRTPLAIIRGNVEGVLDGIYQPDGPRLERILDEVGVITRLVEDLGTLSSVEAGVLRLHRAPTDVSALAADVAASFDAQAAAAGVSISVAADEASGPHEIDDHRVRQVLENLVSNAIRHTDAGGAVRLRLWEEGDWLRIDVSDTGSGISAEELPHIFDRYSKAPGSSGSGLGLAIARRLTEAHGGSITAASAPGEGTTISLSLPRA